MRHYARFAFESQTIIVEPFHASADQNAESLGSL
jgi:hypothetical protein